MTDSVRSAPTLVVLDLDDTLYPYEPCHRAGLDAMLHYGSSETRVPVGEFESRLEEARGRVKERTGATASSHSRLLYVLEALEALEFRFQASLALAPEQEYWRSYILAMHLRPGAEEFLALLRYHHVPVALVTDLTAQIQLRKLIHLRLDALVDHVVFSEEAGGDKSTFKPFELLAERTEPELRRNVWLIGDGPDDVAVSELCARGIFDSGVGWLRSSHEASLLPTKARRWTEFMELETALRPLLDAEP